MPAARAPRAASRRVSRTSSSTAPASSRVLRLPRRDRGDRAELPHGRRLTRLTVAIPHGLRPTSPASTAAEYRPSTTTTRRAAAARMLAAMAARYPTWQCTHTSTGGVRYLVEALAQLMQRHVEGTRDSRYAPLLVPAHVEHDDVLSHWAAASAAKSAVGRDASPPLLHNSGSPVAIATGRSIPMRTSSR